jgi:hypothetical protein
MFKSHGYRLKVNSAPLTAKTVKGVGAIIITAPATEIGAGQIAVLKAYVKDGGNVMINVLDNGASGELVNAFGIKLSNSLVAQAHNTFGNIPKNIIATSILDDPLTKGVKGVAVRQSWALLGAEKNTRILISSSSDAWADLIPDDRLGANEPIGSFGIVVAATVGEGKVIITGDDVLFTNGTIGLAGNKKLLENIIDWFDSPR